MFDIAETALLQEHKQHRQAVLQVLYLPSGKLLFSLGRTVELPSPNYSSTAGGTVLCGCFYKQNTPFHTKQTKAHNLFMAHLITCGENVFSCDEGVAACGVKLIGREADCLLMGHDFCLLC